MKTKLDRETVQPLLKAILLIINSQNVVIDNFDYAYKSSIAYFIKILGIIYLEKSFSVPDRKFHKQIFVTRSINDSFALENTIRFQIRELGLENYFQDYNCETRIKPEYFSEFISILKKILIIDILNPDFLSYFYEYLQQYKISNSESGSDLKQLKLNFEDFILKYNFISCQEIRKKQGSFYTPPELIDRLIKSSLSPLLDKVVSLNDLLSIRILDPACGGGNILIKIFDLLYEKAFKELNQTINSADLKKLIFKNCIYGIEIDKFACEVSRFNLFINGATFDNINNINNSNYLLNDNFDNKFSLIIGNPPYLNIENIEKEERKFYQNNYKTAYRRFDISLLFIEKSLEKMLIPSGTLSFIVSDKILSQNYAMKLREMILNRYTLKEIISFKSPDLFLNAFVSPIILTISNEKSDNTYLRTLEVFKDRENENFIEQKVFSNIYNFSFRVGWNIQKQEIIELIQAKSVPLSEICYVSWGAQPGNAKKFIFNSPDMAEEKHKPYLKKLIRGGNIDRYNISYSGDHLLYLTDGELKLHRPAFKELFESEKITVAEVTASKGIIASYDNLGFYTNHSIINCVHKKKLINVDDSILSTRGIKIVDNKESGNTYKWQENDIAYTRSSYIYKESRFNKLDIKYVLAIMNSRLVNFYFKNFLSGNLNVFPELVRFLPVFDINPEYGDQDVNIGDFKTSLLQNDFEKVSEFLDSYLYRNDYSRYHSSMILIVDKLTELKNNSDIARFLILDNILDRSIFNLYGLSGRQAEYINQA